jgi:Ni,Fe-hydrogenase III small subunit
MKKATCEADGYKAILCEYCDAELEKQTIPATGHDMQKTADEVDATCTEAGKTAVYTCANGCGKTEGGEVIPATGHSFGPWVGEGDCTTTVTLTRTCSRCDATETDEVKCEKHRVPVDANGKPVYDNFKDADCETGSYVYYNCTVCGSSVIEIGEALGHVLVTERVELTCVKNGYVLDTCTRCGRVTETVLEKLGHTWEVMPDMAPTCTADGYENCVKCFTCGSVHYDVVGKTDHADNNGDGICDMCKREYESDGCGCFCHSRNLFIRIIYAIIRFIWKVFGIHRDCVCGKVHF